MMSNVTKKGQRVFATKKFDDVVEKVNLLTSAEGTKLRADVEGKVIMKVGVLLAW